MGIDLPAGPSEVMVLADELALDFERLGIKRLGGGVVAELVIKPAEIGDTVGKFHMLFAVQAADHVDSLAIVRLGSSRIAHHAVQSRQVVQTLHKEGVLLAGRDADNLQRLLVER